MTAQDEIKITGEPMPIPSMCRFVVNRPLLPGRSYFFGNKEQAERSDLAKRLFEIECVRSVLISENSVTVTKDGWDPWPEIGKQIGEAIRAHLASGQPAVDEQVWEQLPSEEELQKRVQEVIDGELNPALGSHGGFVRLVKVEGNRLFLEMGGGCRGCAMAKITLKQGVERVIHERIPEIGEVVDVTDHSSGDAPFYSSQEAL